MNDKTAIPDKSFGGTFVYDKDGKLIDHTPPTKPQPVARPKTDAETAPETAATTEPESAASDEPIGQSTKKRGK